MTRFPRPLRPGDPDRGDLAVQRRRRPAPAADRGVDRVAARPRLRRGRGGVHGGRPGRLRAQGAARGRARRDADATRRSPPSSRRGAARPPSTCSTRSTGTRCATAEPTWVVGWSDIARCCCRSPCGPAGRRCTAGTSRTRRTPRPTACCTGSTSPPRPARSPRPVPGRTRTGWDDYEADPGVTAMTLDRPTSWSVLGGGDAEMSGRAGRRLHRGAVRRWRARRTPTCRRSAASTPTRGCVVYLEACEQGAYDVGPAPARPAPRRLVRARQRRPHRPDAGARRRRR